MYCRTVDPSALVDGRPARQGMGQETVGEEHHGAALIARGGRARQRQGGTDSVVVVLFMTSGAAARGVMSTGHP